MKEFSFNQLVTGSPNYEAVGIIRLTSVRLTVAFAAYELLGKVRTNCRNVDLEISRSGNARWE